LYSIIFHVGIGRFSSGRLAIISGETTKVDYCPIDLERPCQTGCCAPSAGGVHHVRMICGGGGDGWSPRGLTPSNKAYNNQQTHYATGLSR